jgi:hypothetical protein
VSTTPAEQARLDDLAAGRADWRRWGPYVADRQWATVREDYSADGDAWTYFPHDHARSRAYRWGEDGLAGWCDRYQLLVFSLALWNGRDPILKERLFGLTPWEGNHGEDVKEYSFYPDATPTHSYQRFVYKYPHAAYPYRQLLDAHRGRPTTLPEFELLDTGAFDGGRYFDVTVEYAKADPENTCVRITAANRGPDPAELHLVPQLWFRNRWAWAPDPRPQPRIATGPGPARDIWLVADGADADPLPNLPFAYRLGARHLYAPAGGRPMFTDNETNCERVFGPPARSRSWFTKDAFHRNIINRENCLNPAGFGTKAGVHYGPLTIPPGGEVTLRLRLTDRPLPDPLADVDAVVALRRREADEFYDRLHPATATPDERLVQRQALGGLLWSKQVYLFDVYRWLHGDNPNVPPPPGHRMIRNVRWKHLNSMRVLAVPDKWEYPWFAAWDSAFQAVPLALVDPAFAKEQLWLLLFEQFQHPNGQVPAYEWEFSDLNPPVHAWAVRRVYDLDRARTGRADRGFLERCLHKLLLNFAWWVNREDEDGNNLFEGGFLGMDNIALVDRSRPLGPGTQLEQSDATGWMGMFCLDLMRIALELATDDPIYAGLAVKFFQHFVYIGAALNRRDERRATLWSEEDGFFYDLLTDPDGTRHRFRVRSLVGLVPLFGIEVLDDEQLDRVPEFGSSVRWFLANRKDLTDRCVTRVEREGRTRYVLKLMTDDRLARVLGKLADPAEFRSPYGPRSLSRYHREHPFEFDGARVGYEPGDAVTVLKGGNSNWRGPVWFPTAYLLIEALRKLAAAFGPDFRFPAGNTQMAPGELAEAFAEGLIGLFKAGADGSRPCFGDRAIFRDDPHWRDLLLFNEFFHGDTGAGLGASHQTGWTALVASLIDEFRR